ncbi:MAG: NAD-binding protein [Erysipelotrichaceae bacterium]
MYIIVVGCEALGAKLAKELANLNHNIAVIERDENKLEALGGGFNGLIIKGIEFDHENLIQAGINSADAVLALTDDDNLNVTVSLVSSQIFNVKRVIAQVIDPERRHVYELLGIESFSPVKMGVNALLSKMDITPLEQLVQVSSGIEITRIQIRRDNPIKVSQVFEQTNAIVSVVVHKGITDLCNHDTVLEDTDLVVCSHHIRDRKKLMDLLVKEN